MKYALVLTISCFFLFIAFSCSAPHSHQSVATKRNVNSFLYQADPTIFYDNGTYYLYGTNGANADSGFKVFISKDLISWQPSKANNGWALTKGSSYGTQGFWAPQVFFYNGMYYMAYTANEQIAIAKSNSPLGPFTQTTIRAVDTTIKEIDPFVFVDNGTIYLYHVRLQNGNRIFVSELNSSLSAIISGTTHECISAANNGQPWENTRKAVWTVTEGPCLIKRGTEYYMFYSANDFRNPDYAVGYATATSPAGLWVKYTGNPIISRQLTGANGTGHGDLVKDAKNNWWYVLHTHFNDSVVGPRKTAIIKLNFSNNQQITVDTNSFRYLQEVR